MPPSVSHPDSFLQTEPVPVDLDNRDVCITLPEAAFGAQYYELFLFLQDAGISRTRLFAVCMHGEAPEMFYIPNGPALYAYQSMLTRDRTHTCLCYEPLEKKTQTDPVPLLGDEPEAAVAASC